MTKLSVLGGMMSNAAEEIAKAVANLLPVKEIYNDGLSPTVKVGGSILADVAKTLHLALAPLQMTAALQDRFRRFVVNAVRAVPDGNRIPPAPQILGPVLEGVRFETEGSRLDHMFSELLSRASDRARVSEAHPAFPLLIRQLSPDEALLLQQIADRVEPYRRRTMMQLNPATSKFENPATVLEEFPADLLVFSANLDFYVDHLAALGLAGLFRQDDKPIMQGNTQVGTEMLTEYRLTAVGKRLMSATYPPGSSRS